MISEGNRHVKKSINDQKEEIAKTFSIKKLKIWGGRVK